jgi:hypothetical protein
MTLVNKLPGMSRASVSGPSEDRWLSSPPCGADADANANAKAVAELERHLEEERFRQYVFGHSAYYERNDLIPEHP